MENFRSICFVHTQKESYKVCYLKQFFKWVGFSFFTYIPGETEKLEKMMEKPKKQGFDITVKLQMDDCCEEGDNAPELCEDGTITLRYNSKKTENDAARSLMGDLMRVICENILNGYDCRIWNRLVDIYIKKEMTSMLETYTRALMDFAEVDLYKYIYGRYMGVMEELEKIPLETDRQSAGKPLLMEYYLYAKYSTQEKMNQICLKRNKAKQYDVVQLLEEIKQIYEYDPGFYKADYLRAKVAEQHYMFRSMVQTYMEESISKCKVAICKSYLYYELGKYLEESRQHYKAEKLYTIAYQLNPANHKAVFKKAIEYKNKEEKAEEKFYLDILLKKWENCTEEDKKWLPLMNYEYFFKAYMLIGYMHTDQAVREHWFGLADCIVSEIQDHLMRGEEGTFIFALYQERNIDESNIEIVKSICNAMIARLDCKKSYLNDMAKK